MNEQQSGSDGVTLLTAGDAQELSRRWDDIQGRFIDSPKGAVSDADELVSDVIDRIRERLDEGRSSLEDEWRSGGEPTTEDLRRTMQQYRLFFNQVLTTGAGDGHAGQESREHPAEA